MKPLEERLSEALEGLRECEAYVEAMENAGEIARLAALREITSPILYPVDHD
jgi:hypothetical protein